MRVARPALRDETASFDPKNNNPIRKNMKTNLIRSVLALAVLIGLVIPGPAGAEDNPNLNDTIELVRSLYQTDRQAFVAGALELTETESNGFWPLYRSYRTEMEKIGDGLVKLVLEYADAYPNVSEEQATKLLKQYLALEKQLAGTRARYLKKAGKKLPAVKALRWAQLENRMDLALRLQLASAVPVVSDKKP